LAVRLATAPQEFSYGQIGTLREYEFSDTQILEAILITALSLALNTLQVGLGLKPDLAARLVSRVSGEKKVHLSTAASRPTGSGPLADPDAELISRVRQGDLNAFEELMTRHSRRVYRMLIGILGNQEDARDALQDTFLKAFQHLPGFAGRSKFSTWIVSIANNTAVQLLRDRRRLQSLDDSFESSDSFRPRELRAWTDDPEQLFSKAQTRELVASTVINLPAKYRAVVVLRDIEQLSTEDAASALGLGIPAFKARLLRGRLMVREALSPRFALSAKGSAS